MNTLTPRTILALLSLPGFGRKTVRGIVCRYREDPAAPPGDDLAGLLAVYAPDRQVEYHLVEDALKAAAATEKESDERGITVLTPFSESFPARLCDIPDPPILLFAKGRLRALCGAPTVAVIGTREPTAFGGRAALRLGKRFAEQGFVVVSGLAKGCDTFAHRGCIDEKGVGVAVLAHGLATVYPAENRRLAEELLDCGGCLVSEYPPGVRAHRGHFVERDRLQSGLSLGVVVVETAVEGGTMHTVRYAREQGRLLACVKHPTDLLDEATVQGNLKLLGEGAATPLADAADLERFAARLLNGDAAQVPPPGKMAAGRSAADGEESLWG